MTLTAAENKAIVKELLGTKPTGSNYTVAQLLMNASKASDNVNAANKALTTLLDNVSKIPTTAPASAPAAKDVATAVWASTLTTADGDTGSSAYFLKKTKIAAEAAVAALKSETDAAVPSNKIEEIVTNAVAAAFAAQKS